MNSEFTNYDGRVISLPEELVIVKGPTMGDAQRYAAVFRFRDRRWSHEFTITNRLIADSGPEVFLHQAAKSLAMLMKVVEAEHLTCENKQ